jgi:hypothetical protein
MAIQFVVVYFDLGGPFSRLTYICKLLSLITIQFNTSLIDAKISSLIYQSFVTSYSVMKLHKAAVYMHHVSEDSLLFDPLNLLLGEKW